MQIPPEEALQSARSVEPCPADQKPWLCPVIMAKVLFPVSLCVPCALFDSLSFLLMRTPILNLNPLEDIA